MTFSSLASERHDTFQKSSRQGATIDTFLIHHQASTDARGTLRLMISGGRTVSANYIITNEGHIWGVVGEEWRAWTSGSATDGGKGAAWDRRSITVEIENETGAPEWRISQAAINAAAALLSDLRRRYPIRNVLGHRDLWNNFRASYATYCPGPDTVNRILNGSSGGVPVSVPTQDVGWNITSRPVADIQAKVGAGVDGIYGPETTAKVKAWQAANGLEADGIWGPLSDAKAFGGGGAVVTVAPPFPLPSGYYFGPKEGPVESVSGYYSYRGDLTRFQQRLIERGWIFRWGADGLYGPETAENVKAFQREKGLVVDGLIGPQTWKAAWEAPIT